MDHAAFVALVERLQVESATRPALYRWKVVALGALAYAFLGSVVLLALASLGLVALALTTKTALSALLKLGWLLVAFVYSVARSLWVRLDPPAGLALHRDRVPALFGEIDDVCRHVGVAAPHQVLLVDELNAAMSQHPRLGMLGWPRNSLILGLPLLQALSREELRAVLAHEFGHLAGAHGHAGAWVYRVRQTWTQLLERMERAHGFGSALFRPFFRWHAPYFAAYSFVLARLQEYEADRISARAATPRAAVDALARVRIAGSALDAHWRSVWRLAGDAPEPDARPFTRLSPEILTLRSAADAEQLLRAELAEETGHADTHPCLRERAAALGEEPRVPPPVERSAAATLLGAELPALAAHFDRAWRQRASESWRARHAEVRANRAKLTALEAKRAAEPLSTDEQCEYAMLVEELRSPEEALALQREVLARAPGHVSANVAAGRLLLARGEEAGLAHLEAAIASSHTAILGCWREGHEFLQRAGRREEAERWLARARAHEQRLAAASRERDTIPFDGRFERHDLSADALAALRRSLTAHADVENAWLVRRRLEHFDDDYPQWVLCVARRAGLLELPQRKRERDVALQERLVDIDVQGDVRILVVNHRSGADRIHRGVSGAHVYPA